MTWPQRLRILSDDTEISFTRELRRAKLVLGEYVFTKARYNTGRSFLLTIEQVAALIDRGRAVAI